MVRALESAGELQRAVSVLLHDFTDEPEASQALIFMRN